MPTIKFQVDSIDDKDGTGKTIQIDKVLANIERLSIPQKENIYEVLESYPSDPVTFVIEPYNFVLFLSLNKAKTEGEMKLIPVVSPAQQHYISFCMSVDNGPTAKEIEEWKNFPLKEDYSEWPVLAELSLE